MISSRWRGHAGLVLVLCGGLLSLLLGLLPASRAAGGALIAEPIRGGQEGEGSLGFALEFGPPEGAMVDIRRARQVALFVPEGTSPTPWLAPGPFRARFHGRLELAARERLVFAFEGRGRVRLFLDGELAHEEAGPELTGEDSKRLRLDQGAHEIRVEYESPATGDARLRLFWQGQGFPRETIAPRFVRHDRDGPLFAESDRRRKGRKLIHEFRCARCHATEAKGEPAAGLLPLEEVAPLGPDLRGVGARLTPAHLERWIVAPHTVRPEARMPALFKPGQSAATNEGVRDLLAHLLRLKGDTPRASRPSENLALGAQLFADLGCIGCHQRPDKAPAAGADDDRLPLAHVGEKFLPGALAEFLRAPERHYPQTRMPNFGFSAEEAGALEAWLRSMTPEVGDSPPLGDPEKGAALGLSLGCAACHEGFMVGGIKEVQEAAAKPLAALGGAAAGCLAEAPATDASHPRYELDSNDRAALLAALASTAAVHRYTVAEEGQEALVALRCVTCHAIDGAEPAWTRFETEVQDLTRPHQEGELAQDRPDLSWVGEKLHREWIERVLQGDPKTQMRPWLRARMPAFPGRAARLAEALVAAHGMEESAQSTEPPSPDLVHNGAFLGGAEGFGCGACHQLGEVAAYARFEFGANDLSATPKRLRKEFFLRWMWDPRRVDPANRMPLYADEEGYTRFDEIFDGEAKPQFDAIWAWLQSLSHR